MEKSPDNFRFESGGDSTGVPAFAKAHLSQHRQIESDAESFYVEFSRPLIITFRPQEQLPVLARRSPQGRA